MSTCFLNTFLNSLRVLILNILQITWTGKNKYMSMYDYWNFFYSNQIKFVFIRFVFLGSSKVCNSSNCLVYKLSLK